MKPEIAIELSCALGERLETINPECPICHHAPLAIMPGVFINVLHKEDLNILKVGPDVAPTVPLICLKCGFISQHSIPVLLKDEAWESFEKRYVKNESDSPSK